jgi:hypothetical protein
MKSWDDGDAAGGGGWLGPGYRRSGGVVLPSARAVQGLVVAGHGGGSCRRRRQFVVGDPGEGDRSLPLATFWTTIRRKTALKLFRYAGANLEEALNA